MEGVLDRRRGQAQQRAEVALSGIGDLFDSHRPGYRAVIGGAGKINVGGRHHAHALLYLESHPGCFGLQAESQPVVQRRRTGDDDDLPSAGFRREIADHRAISIERDDAVGLPDPGRKVGVIEGGVVKLHLAG